MRLNYLMVFSCLFFCFTFHTMAQEESKEHTDPQTTLLVQVLELEENQVKKAKKILQEAEEGMEAIDPNDSFRTPKKQAVMQQCDRKMKKILTPEQWQNYRENKSKFFEENS